MSSDDSYLDGMYEKLSAAIMQSITSSDEISEILQDLGSKNLIHDSAVFNLLLNLEELDSFMNPKPFHEETYKLEPPKPLSSPKVPWHLVIPARVKKTLLTAKSYQNGKKCLRITIGRFLAKRIG